MKNFIKRYLKLIITFIKAISDTEISKLSGATDMSRLDIAKLKCGFSKNEVSLLFGRRIEFSNSFWHLHSLREIFVEETYKFRSRHDNPLILDCGANVGLSIIYFKRLYPKAKIIAFEPDPYIFAKMTNNLKVWDYENIRMINCAIWTKDTTLNFESNGALGGKINNGNRKKNTIDIKAEALNNYLHTKVDFLKIDIEGAEFEVINSIKNKLHYVENLFIEYHSDPAQKQNLPNLLTTLQDAGFRMYIKEAWNNMPIPFEYFRYRPYWDLQLNIFAYRR